MAKKTIIELIDDLSGEPLSDNAGRTVAFSIDGADYEIDLSHANIETMKSALEPYISASRRVSGRAKSTGARRGRNSPEELQQIRDWAAKNGFKVAQRGRISSEVLEAYSNR